MYRVTSKKLKEQLNFSSWVNYKLGWKFSAVLTLRIILANYAKNVMYVSNVGYRLE